MRNRLVRLGDVVEINPSVRPTIRPDEMASFVAMANVSEEGRIIKVQQRPLVEVQKGYTAFLQGDVLLAKITPCFENGKAALVDSLPTKFGFGSTEFHVLRHGHNVDPRFLFHLVWNQHFRRLGASRMTGSAGQKRVPTAYLADYEFLLPSVVEQQHVAAVLDKAHSLRRKRQEAMSLAAELARSKFAEMFGEPRTNVRGLQTVALGEVAKLKSGDFLPSHEMAGTGDVLVYGGNGVNGRHDRAMFADAKLAIGRVGAYCGAVHLTKPRSWITDNALYVSEVSSEVRLEYLAFALTQANLNQYSSQSGQPLVSASRLYPVKIVLPPLTLQDKFLEMLSRLRIIQERQASSLRAIDEMSRALTAELFSKG